MYSDISTNPILQQKQKHLLQTIDFTLAETLRTSSTGLPGAPLTSFFDSLSPLQKQLLLQQQFQKVSSNINEDSQSISLHQRPTNANQLNLQATSLWFPVGINIF